MKVIWSPEGRQDLRDIYLYLAAENPYAARTLHERIKQGIQLLRDNPHIGRPGRVSGTRELAISGTSYIRWNKFPDLKQEIEAALAIDACYGPEHQEYRYLIRGYLTGDLPAFLSAALAALPRLMRDYYRRALESLVNRALSEVRIEDIPSLQRLEQEAASYLALIFAYLGQMAARTAGLAAAEPYKVYKVETKK
jgi:toxin ParE1/3/4